MGEPRVQTISAGPKEMTREIVSCANRMEPKRIFIFSAHPNETETSVCLIISTATDPFIGAGIIATRVHKARNNKIICTHVHSVAASWMNI